jgi:excisionase family DNA binding protein
MAIDNYHLRSRDVAQLLDLTPDEVVQLAQSGKLRATKVGRLWRYRLADVIAYRKRQERDRIATRLSPFA